MTAQVQSVVAELRHRLEQLYGDRLVRLVLYGSQARGDAEPGSDIDVLIALRGLVDSGQEISKAGEVTASLSLAHDVVISCVFVSEEEFAREQSPLLLNARREGMAV